MSQKQLIVPHLWFDKEAREAADFYTNLFPDSGIENSYIIKDTPSGDCDFIIFTLSGMSFNAISAGPYFSFTPAFSFMVSCGDEETTRKLWNKLIEGGQELMPLGEYDYSKCYGWLTDQYGVNWQLITIQGYTGQAIAPCMLFSGPHNGMAKEAMDYYVKVFENSCVKEESYYGEWKVQAEKARIDYAEFSLNGQKFIAMDNAFNVDFTFTEAASLVVLCKDQDEIDYYWDKLSHVPEAEQCGWCKDRFGMSWQIIPEDWNEMYQNGTEEQIERLTAAVLRMKKFNLKELDDARFKS